MNNSTSIRSAVKEIVSGVDKSILLQPDDFRQALIDKGVSGQDALTVALILEACPAVGDALSRKDITRSEATALISAATNATGLSVACVRRILGELIYGNGGKPEWYTRMTELTDLSQLPERFINARRHVKNDKWSIVGDAEDSRVNRARIMLADEKKQDAALSELQNLADEGNAVANYAVGEYYCLNGKNFQEKSTGREYLTLASWLGYGPANGALANLELQDPDGSIGKAARYLSHPLALRGNDGRKWVTSAQRLANYADDNVRRGKVLLLLTLILFFIAIFSVPVHPLAGSLSAIMVAVGFVRSVACVRFNRYLSHFLTIVLLMAAWLLLVLTI